MYVAREYVGAHVVFANLVEHLEPLLALCFLPRLLVGSGGYSCAHALAAQHDRRVGVQSLEEETVDT